MSESTPTGIRIEQTSEERPDLATEVLDILQARFPQYVAEKPVRAFRLSAKGTLNRSTANLCSVFKKIALSSVATGNYEMSNALYDLADEYEEDSAKPENCLWRHNSTLPEFSGDHVRRVDQPFEIPNSDAPIWDNLQKFVTSYLELPGFDKTLANDILITHLKSKLQELIAGSLNLLNLVIAYQDIGHQLGALVFLDKSARNGAHIYRTLWHEFSKRGQINPKYKKPNERFINIGLSDPQFKISSEAAFAFLADQYKNEDFGTRSLVVDEWMSSGGSAGNAANILNKLSGIPFDRVAQFIKVPPFTTLSGISDSNSDMQSRIYYLFINKLDENQIKKLISFRNETGKNTFAEKVAHILQTDDEANVEIKAILKTLYESADIDLNNFGKSLDKVINYAGGLLAEPSGSQNRRQVIEYRTFLTELTKAFVKLSSGEKVEEILESVKSKPKVSL
jgi:hypothetical protein